MRNLSLAHELRRIDDENRKSIIEELDMVIEAATRGDRDAIGAILIAFGPTLLEEARVALGASRAHDAPDAVHDLAEHLLAADLHFKARRGSGIPFLRRTVRLLARRMTRRRPRPRPRRAVD